MSNEYSTVLEAISEIERHYKDTSGGYDLPLQVVHWMRGIPLADQHMVIETLFFQFENGLRYGYMLPEIIRLLPAPEYLERLLRTSLALPHLGASDYDDILSSLFGFGPEYNSQFVAIAREVIRAKLAEGDASGVVLLCGLMRLGVPAVIEDAATYLSEWISSTEKVAFLDVLLLQFGDFFPKESVQSLFAAAQRLKGVSHSTFTSTVLTRIDGNLLLRVSCKWLRAQIEKHRNNLETSYLQ